MTEASPEVEAFLAEERPWLQEMRALRAIVRTSPLTEGLKWRWPCYAAEGGNVVLIHAFKDYCALLFVKGALLKDAEGLLVRQTENVQSSRQMRFASLGEIETRRRAIEAYVREAIEVERAGLKAPKAKAAEIPRPVEFQQRLETAPELAGAFAGLTPGRQRAYLLYFAGAKQSKTRAARVENCVARILEGKGLDD